MKLLAGILLLSVTGARCLAGIVMQSAQVSPTTILIFSHDDRFKYVMEEDPENYGQVMRFTAVATDGTSAQELKLRLEADPKGLLKDPASGAAIVKAMCTPYLGDSVEKACLVHTVKGNGFDVYYCVLTDASIPADKTPGPNDYRYMIVGEFKAGDFVLTALGYSNSKEGPDFESLLDIMRRVGGVPIVKS